MHRIRAPRVLLLAAALTVPPALAGSPPGAAAAPGAWTTYVSGRQAAAIAAGAAGQVWTASSGGATAFDPADSTTLRLVRNDGLPDQDLTAVAVDAGGRVWFGSRARGLQVRDANGRFLRRPLDQFDLGSDSVRVLQAVGAELWVGTASGAALVTYPPDPAQPSGAVLSTFNIQAFLGQSPLINAIAARGDTTWFGTQRGVVRRDPGGQALLNDGLGNLDIRALAFFDGHVWAATAASVERLEDGQWVERANGLAPGRPHLAFVVFEGALHLGAAMGPASVYKLDPASLAWTARSSGIENRNAVGLAVAGGTLWAATNRGLYRLGVNEVWRMIPVPDPPGPAIAPSNDYLDIAVVPTTREARAVTRTFVTELDPGGAWRAAQRGAQGIENTDLSRLLVDRSGETWLGHCCCGTGTTCRLDRLPALGGQAAPFGAHDLLAASAGPDGRVWFGSVRTDQSEGEGLYRIDPASGALEHYDRARVPALASNSIQALAFDGAGRLWIGHTGEGVDIWSAPGVPSAAITHLDLQDGLPSLQVTALAVAGDEIWIGTAAGIVVFNDILLRVRTIPGSDLPNPRVADLAADGCGRLWIATSAGVLELGPGAERIALFDDRPEAIPGIVDQRVAAIDIDPEAGVVWFATMNGLSRYEYDVSCATSGGMVAGSCFRLCPYPNPFEPGRDGALRLTDLGAAPAGVTVSVHDSGGREVRAARPVAAGAGVWDGLDESGSPVPSGIYVLRVAGVGEAAGAERRDPVLRPVAVRR